MKPAAAGLLVLLGFAGLTACSTQVDLEWPGADDDDDDDALDGVVFAQRFQPEFPLGLLASAQFQPDLTPLTVGECRSLFPGQGESRYVGDVTLLDVDDATAVALAWSEDEQQYAGNAGTASDATTTARPLQLVVGGTGGILSVLIPDAVVLPPDSFFFTSPTPVQVYPGATITWDAGQAGGTDDVFLGFIQATTAWICVVPNTGAYTIDQAEIANIGDSGTLFGSWLEQRVNAWAGEGTVYGYGLTVDVESYTNPSPTGSGTPTPSPTPTVDFP